MSVGASSTHNIVRYSDDSISECKCMKRTCPICNPNPTTDLIFGLRGDLASLTERLQALWFECERKEARIKELEQTIAYNCSIIGGMQVVVNGLAHEHNKWNKGRDD